MQPRVRPATIAALGIMWLVTVSAAAERAKKGLDAERLQVVDTNHDGQLAPAELGDRLWKRLGPFDANADGILSAAEVAAFVAAKSGDKDKPNRPGGANASFTVLEHLATNGRALRYSLYVPPNAPKSLPLVLCLHGSGGNTAAANLLAGPAAQQKHPCIILAPACSARSTRWVESTFRGNDKQHSVLPELMETLTAVVSDTHADPARIYVTGQSMGGVGTWGLIAAHPERFAAAVPICGHWLPADAEKIAPVPIWAFHGAKDPTVPVEGTRAMIAALRGAGSSPKYTEFAEVGHGSWDAAYATDGLWEWVFCQRQ